MAVIFILLSALTMLLWNYLMPDIANLPRINFCQAAGLFLLARILSGFIAPAIMAHHHRNFKERWRLMNKEERNEFIEKMHSLCYGSAQTHEKKDE